MAVGLEEPDALLPVAGVRLCALTAGIRYSGRSDVAVLEFAAQSTAAAVFTRNAFCAAPVTVAREHLAQAAPRYALINSGNANAGTGEPGLRVARQSCAALAHRCGVSSQQVLPFSTGVIGEPLPLERMQAVFPQVADALDDSGDAWLDAARAIMTTDTVAKGCSRQIEVDGKTVTLTGIAKGSGMIRPDMATMLAFVCTDAAIPAGALQTLLGAGVERSFNRITVDGDTSTNDACLLVATAASGVAIDVDAVTGSEVDAGTERARQAFVQALDEVLLFLAQAMIRDGEGASKFVQVRVDGGRDVEECLQVAYTIAHSPLVKTALFASDPNWGRILAAAGRAGISDLDVNRVQLWLDDYRVVRDGGPDPAYEEAQGAAVMASDEFEVRLDLGRGPASECVWTSDLSYDYVKINADYRS